jgi:hypothetical protein
MSHCLPSPPLKPAAPTFQIAASSKQTQLITGPLLAVGSPCFSRTAVGAILVPGNPLRFDISWVDQATTRYYLGEAGNASVDVFDARNDLFLGRITGFHGIGTPDDPCGPTQGMGPSGVVVTPNNQLWLQMPMAP